MKMSKILALILAVVMVMSCLTACFGPTEKPNDNPTPDGGETNPLAGTYDITIWASELDGVAELFQSQIDKFEAANPGIVINATISGVTEADAGSQVLLDLPSAPDMYCFAQDQLARLVQGGALAAPSAAVAEQLRAANDAGSVGAASVAGTMYAYPMTSDNGYYMYYDTSIITNPDSLEQIIADVEAYNAAHPDSPKWIRYALENGWYTASFFFATGCHTVWNTDESGNFTSVEDNFNSEAGVKALKGMMKLAQSSAYNSDSDAYADSAVWINGIWNAEKAEDFFGENFGVTDLPSFTVDGEEFHLGSFSGNKLIGVKPQADSKKGLVLSLLAQFLTNEQCQLERFDAFQWGPSNVKAQESEGVQANPSLAALALQGAYAKPEANIGGSWWDLAKVLGADAKTFGLTEAGTSAEEDIRASLTTYENAIKALFEMTDEQKMAWSVIGAVSNTNWNTDFSMTQVSEGVWESVVITLTMDSQLKLRRGASWDVQFGADGQLKTPTIEPANIVPNLEGQYKVRLEWDGVSEKATITFIPAE